VVNEKTGKLIDLPHPVENMRVWDESLSEYRPIDATLDGAPKGSEEISAYFNRQLAELKEEMGVEYIDELMQIRT